ncbi:MAG: hypothetical protein WA160_01720 [Pseudobdellovibrio sp.]
MNIRMDSTQVRFRINQAEVKTLLDKGCLKEEIQLPSDQICFHIRLGEQTQIIQNGNDLVFWIASAEQEKIKNLPQTKEAIAALTKIVNGKEFKFLLEVDIFNDKQRGRRK